MITYKFDQNIFDSQCQTLVNTVNCVGVMGKGLALQFKEKYPLMYKAYLRACSQGLLKSGGDLWLWQEPFILPFCEMPPRSQVLCFATKEHWRDPSQYRWVDRGLHTLAQEYEKMGITSIALPKLGCTNGGLDWGTVKGLMEMVLGDLPLRVEIYC